MEFKRSLKLASLLKSKSYFLLGPRSTGKSFLIKQTWPQGVLNINLLSSDIYLRLSEQPSLIREMAAKSKSALIVIDEIQRLPILLNEVQNLIEEDHRTFLLTGSSARKLKRENANMLGGRAGQLNLFPLSFSEIPNFNLEKYLTHGGLPRIYLAEDPLIELEAYVSVYLEEEIKAEAHVRNLVPFNRFLKAACLNNGQLINFSNIANETGIPASTVREYYTLLQDTLVGLVLEPWLESKKRKAIQTSKFYFFDPGVCHFILGLEKLERNSNFWGQAFEQFICMELRSYLSYRQKRKKLYFWRSVNKHEVDFIIGEEIAIEVKSTKKVLSKHLNGLKALNEEKIIKNFYLISEDTLERTTQDGFILMHWRNFLVKLWDGEII